MRVRRAKQEKSEQKPYGLLDKSFVHWKKKNEKKKEIAEQNNVMLSKNSENSFIIVHI